MRPRAKFCLAFGLAALVHGLTLAAEPASVHHSPQQPRSGEAVQINATLPPGVTAATLEYQVVDPGKYIERNDPAYKTNWIPVRMSLSGGSFAASLSGEVQKHRRLVRYRIKASESGGKEIRLPEIADSQPNFAYFVYDGVPSWRGAIEPGSADPARSKATEFSVKVSLPVYHLITRRSSAEAATWNGGYSGHEYKWSGTLVYDGKVYDHIGYRARGGTWRYAMGKNMWKFAFNKGHEFQARDNYGNPYSIPWSKLNLGACIQQGQYGHRGEHGMFEAVGFKLFNLAGVEASDTHWIHFRIIDDTQEASPTNQYAGDFWGLYLAVEEMGGRFLKEHHLPNGNLFKMENGTGELKTIGASGITNKTDLNQFLAAYNSGNPTEQWWRGHLDLARYYDYRSIIEGIHHYDVGQAKNYFYLLDPQSRRWSVHPWDLDLTWANSMYGDGGEPFKSGVLSRPALRLEYQNRLREIRDLLFNTNQTWRLIDQFAQVLTGGLDEPTSFVAADRARWDYAPVMAQGGNAGQGLFYQASPTKDFAGMVRLMKTFVRKRSTWIDTVLLKDPAVPGTPDITWTGPADFSQLTFDISSYRGSNVFATMQWRLAEVSPQFQAKAGTRGNPYHYEITPLWQSPELQTPNQHFSLPTLKLAAAGTYRVRARVKDQTGRWSHWSAPFEFVQPTPGR